MIVDIVDVENVRIHKAEDHSPVRSHRDGPSSFHLALQRVQSKTRYVHIIGSPGGIKTCEDVAQFGNVLRENASRVVPLVKTLQAPMAYGADQFAP